MSVFPHCHFWYKELSVKWLGTNPHEHHPHLSPSLGCVCNSWMLTECQRARKQHCPPRFQLASLQTLGLTIEVTDTLCHDPESSPRCCVCRGYTVLYGRHIPVFTLGLYRISFIPSTPRTPYLQLSALDTPKTLGILRHSDPTLKRTQKSPLALGPTHLPIL